MNKEITDNIAYRFPISMKGIVIIDGKIILLKNERDEWELPGGKLEIGEVPENCVVREIEEELSINVSDPEIIDTWMYHIKEGVIVFIVTYGFKPLSNMNYKFSHEHKAADGFTIDQLDDLKMPEEYKISIKRWFERLSHAQ